MSSKIKQSTAGSEQGMSAVEIIFVTAIMVSVTLVILPSINTYRKVFDSGMAEAKGQGDLRRAISTIKRDLKEAKQGTDAAGCNVNAPSGVCIQVSPAVISFKVPEATSGGVTTYKTVQYSYNSGSGNLTRTEIPSTGLPASLTDIVGRGITNVGFTQGSNDSVTISLSGSGGSLTTNAFLRNKY